MSKPKKHYGGWQIRWTDENGKRRSKTLTTRQEAELELQRQLLAVRKRKLGLRPPEKAARTFAHAATYWSRTGHRRSAAARMI